MMVQDFACRFSWTIKQYRLWCSEKDDHAGAVSDFFAKERMEFYPDQLPAEMIERLWSGNLIER